MGGVQSRGGGGFSGSGSPGDSGGEAQRQALRLQGQGRGVASRERRRERGGRRAGREALPAAWALQLPLCRHRAQCSGFPSRGVGAF